MKNAPNKIYLQVGEGNEVEDFNDLCEVTWSINRVYDSDLEYVLSEEYLNEKIKAATPRWKGVDAEEWLKEIRGYETM